MFQETSQDFSFCVKIIPNSSKNEVIGWENDKLKLKIKAPAEKGKANLELISFLAKVFKIAKSKIILLKGKKSPLKKILVKDLSKEKVLTLLKNLT